MKLLGLKIKAIVFDIDGTLYKSETYVKQLIKGICQTISELLSIPYEEAEQVFQELRSEFGSISLGLRKLGIDRSRFYQLLIEKLDPKKAIRPRPELTTLFKQLKDAGLKIGCHTNSSRRLAEMVLEALGIELRLLDVLVTCDDAEPKPLPDGYLKILEELRLEPQEVLYVGDRWRVELEPAKKLGMKTVLVSSKPEGEPDLVIGDVLELPEKIKSLKDP